MSTAVTGVTETDVQFRGYAAREKSGHLSEHDYFPRVLGEFDVEIAIDCCGICHSDVHTITSGWGPAHYPVIPGHEIVGHVTKVGTKVDSLTVGQRVGVGAQAFSCRNRGGKSCGYCAEDNDSYCNSGVFTYDGVYPDGQISQGGYANGIRLQADLAIPIPDEIESEHAAPMMCAGVTVFSPLRFHGAGPGKKVGIVGIGGLGHLAVQFAKALGCDEVVAISHSESKRELATTKLGATKFINTTDPKQIEANLQSLDMVLCTAVWDGFDCNPYLDLVKKSGKFILVAIPEGELKISPFKLIMGRYQICGSLIGGRKDLIDMLNVAKEHNVRPIVELRPMAECNEGVKHLLDNKVRFRTVLQQDLPKIQA